MLSLAGRELKHTLNFLLHYLWFGLQHVKLTPRTLTTETDKQKIAASRREAIVPHAENLPRKSKLILVTLCVRESCLARFALNRCSILIRSSFYGAHRDFRNHACTRFGPDFFAAVDKS